MQPPDRTNIIGIGPHGNTEHVVPAAPNLPAWGGPFAGRFRGIPWGAPLHGVIELDNELVSASTAYRRAADIYRAVVCLWVYIWCACGAVALREAREESGMRCYE